MLAGNSRTCAIRFARAAGIAGLCLCAAKADAWDTFSEAVYKNDVADMEAFLHAPDPIPDIDVRGANGKTALMIVARSGEADLVMELLERGADPNSENINGGTPLMFAAMSGSIPVVRALLDHGADVSATGSNGWDALMVASAKGHGDAVQMLLDHGADVNSADVYRWTPLHRAAYENRVSVVGILIRQEGVEIDFQDDQGATALHHAAAGGYREIVDMLLVAGSDPARRDLSGRTAAAYAEGSGHERLAHRLEGRT